MAVAATPRGNYPEIRPTFSARAARLSIGLLVLLATLLGASSAASAAVALSVAPQFPDTQVGQQNVPATVEIDNNSHPAAGRGGDHRRLDRLGPELR